VPAVDEIRARIRKLSNSARYKEAHALAKKMLKKHPRVLLFAYLEAVYSAEDDINFSPKQIRRRHKMAAQKLKPLLRRLRAGLPQLRFSLRNEYYWFSHQPYKQYRLGIEAVRKGNKRAYYCQGVGAAELAKKYALDGRPGLCRRWARISEKAWMKFFKEDSNWFNSYFFYATALGIQGREREMEAALQRAAKIAGKSLRWKALRQIRIEVVRARQALDSAAK
jgi:hypothetical protein